MILMMGYKYEKSQETQDKNREQNMLIQFAENLFDVWDPDRDGYMLAHKLVENAVMLGLARNKEFIYRLISITLKKPLDGLESEKVTREEFAKLAHSSRLVNRILKIVNEATKAMLKDRKKNTRPRM